MTQLIKLENITKLYQLWEEELKILKWINLEVNTGEFISIMWQSGSWKSTLMNIIWMLDKPTKWNYWFNWSDVSWLDVDEQSLIRRKSIWFIFQNYNLLKRTSAIEQVMLPLMYQWVSTKKRKEMAYEALKRVWLWDKINNYPNEMSWWQQQRVAIARAIVTNPLLILWDEPTWALDTKTWDEVMELISELNNEWKTIVIITHSPEVDCYAKIHINIRDGLIQD